MNDLSNSYLTKGLMGHYVKTFRAPKTQIIYIRHAKGDFSVCEMPEQLQTELDSTVQFRTFKKYLPVLLIEKENSIVRVFRQPKRELFKNQNLNFIGR